MRIEWLGHACFGITLKDGTYIVTDPFDASVGYKKPDVFADIVTVSHLHHDHNATENLRGYRTRIDKAGEFRFANALIRSVPSFHDEDGGKKRGGNLIFRIEADGKSVVHLGDLGHMPDDKQLAFIKNADVLLIPIGGTYTITTEQALELIHLARPVCCVPMHFLTAKLTFPITDEKQFASKTGAAYLKKTSEDVENLSGCVIFDYE